MTPVPAPENVTDRVHAMRARVYYEDTDSTGVVYHASYLRFLERGRSDFLRAIGVTHAMLLDGPAPVAFAVLRMEIDFLAPARLEDVLEVRSAFAGLAGARLSMRQSIARDGARDGRELVRAQLVLACVTPEGRPARPPKVLVNALAPYQGGVLKTT